MGSKSLATAIRDVSTGYSSSDYRLRKRYIVTFSIQLHILVVGERPSTSSSVGTGRFSPKLEVTKIAVDPLVWKQFQRTVECRLTVEREKIDNLEESIERHLPVIVSYCPTESLQRFITKSMQRRRRERKASPMESRKRLPTRKRLHQKNFVLPLKRKSLSPRKRRLQLTELPAAATSNETDPAEESREMQVFDQAREMSRVVEDELEIQPDGIMCCLQVRPHA